MHMRQQRIQWDFDTDIQTLAPKKNKSLLDGGRMALRDTKTSDFRYKRYPQKVSGYVRVRLGLFYIFFCSRKDCTRYVTNFQIKKVISRRSFRVICKFSENSNLFKIVLKSSDKVNNGNSRKKV